MSIAQPHAERLSALDAAMVFMETSATHMHIGQVGILDAGPLATPGGGVDVERIRAHIAGLLDMVPRYRQRLAFIPVEHHPVWVDDDRFDLDYHLNCTALPRPGSVEQLKGLVGRIMSSNLDLARPVWEFWVVEGLEGGRFAMVHKVHHCVVDGIAAVNVLGALFSPDPNAPAHRPSTWRPRPAPAPVELAVGELLRRAGAPLEFVRNVETAVAHPGRTIRGIRDTAVGAAQTILGAMRRAPRTPINVDAVGPHRRVDWTRFDLEDVKAVKNRAGGTVNDCVLATVTGAVRRYFRAHGSPVHPPGFRIVVPLNVRPDPVAGALGNRVVPLLMRVPLDVDDPRERLRAVADASRALKASKQVRAIAAFEEVANWGDAALISEVVRRATRWWAGNLIVTNVPGPPLPLYCLGARLLEGYPLIPMMANQALSVACLSYAGGLYWGLNADRDTVPDLPALAGCFTDEFEELRNAAPPVP